MEDKRNRGYLIQLSEVEERIKITETRLKEYKEFYDNLFQNNHLAAFLIDVQTLNIVDANPTACSFYGYRREGFKTKKITDISLTTQEEILQILQQVKSKEQNGFVFKHRTANGYIKNVKAYIYPISLDDRQLLYTVINDITERTRIEKEIKLAYKELDSIFNTISDSMWVIDKNFTVLRINKSFTSLLHMSKDKVLGKKCYELFPGQYCQTSNCPLVRIATGEQYIEYQVEKKINNNKKYSFFMTANPFRGVNGEIIGIVESYKNITSYYNKIAERLLKNKLFKKLFFNAKDAFFLCKLDEFGRLGKFIEVNDYACMRLGYSREELLNLSYFEIFFKGEGQSSEEIFQEILQKGYCTFERTCVTKNGKEFISEFTVHLIEVSGEKILLSIASDITERKKTEKIIKESEERYRKLTELSPDAIVVHCEGKIIFANTAAVNLVQAKNLNEIIGKKALNFVHPDYRKIAENRLLEAQKQKLSALEYKFLRVDGTAVDVEVVTTFFTYNEKLEVLCVIRDISERKRELEKAALLQKQRLETEFPLDEKADLEVIYKPAKIVSGDLFHFYKYDDYNVIGFLGDVTGKGLAASLNNSAVKVLFYEKVSVFKEPLDILCFLNMEVKKYLLNDFVAAICFRFDFKNNQLKVASAGINKFSISQNGDLFEKQVRGPFLGMLEESLFEEQIVSFQKGDKFYFYTDGLEELLEDDPIFNKVFTLLNIKEQKNYLESLLECRRIKDDITCLTIEIK